MVVSTSWFSDEAQADIAVDYEDDFDPCDTIDEVLEQGLRAVAEEDDRCRRVSLLTAFDGEFQGQR